MLLPHFGVLRLISIHSPRVGRDATTARALCGGVDFNPLSPRGERLDQCRQELQSCKISIHSPRVGRDLRVQRCRNIFRISIHSPRVGRDRSMPSASCGLRTDFNPLSPRGERLQEIPTKTKTIGFQSTLPAWGETRAAPGQSCAPQFQSTLPAWGETGPAAGHDGWRRISIHSPRVGRDRGERDHHGGPGISIHSPRVGRDAALRAAEEQRQEFQSTLPAWGETSPFRFSPEKFLISIHSPRVGRDEPAQHHGLEADQFQSTLPAWGETQAPAGPKTGIQFQSTLPAWGETAMMFGIQGHFFISIHSPRVGRDYLGDAV